MLSGSLTLKNAAAADKVFTVITYNDKGSKRIDESSTVSEPRVLNIQHTSSGSGLTKVDRHLIQFQEAIVDSTQTYRVTTNVTITVPEGIDPAAAVADQIAFLLDFLSSTSAPAVDSTRVAQILRGES